MGYKTVVVIPTYWYEVDRQFNSLPFSHTNDAICIKRFEKDFHCCHQQQLTVWVN